MDLDAIKHLQNRSDVQCSEADPATTMFHPRDMELTGMEPFALHRARERNRFETSSLESFIAYTNDRGAGREVDGAVRTTVDIDTCSAAAIFNLREDRGGAAVPGHGDDIATCTLVPSAAYRFVLGLHASDTARSQGTVFDQRDLVDAIRDWHEEIANSQAMALAFQRIDVEHVRKGSREETDSSRERTAMERIEAKAQGNDVPRELGFTFTPYAGFEPRVALLSVAVQFDGDEVSLRVKVRALERLREAIASEFAGKLAEALDVAPLLGTLRVAP